VSGDGGDRPVKTLLMTICPHPTDTSSLWFSQLFRSQSGICLRNTPQYVRRHRSQNGCSSTPDGCVDYAARRFRTFLPRPSTRPDRLCLLRTAAAATRCFGLLADSENRASASITLLVVVRPVSTLSFAKPSAIPRNVPDQTRAGCSQNANQKFQGLYINDSHLRLEAEPMRYAPNSIGKAADLFIQRPGFGLTVLVTNRCFVLLRL
jgi:hypothetical protein